MNKEILIVGGYGNFGKRIAKQLVKNNIPIIISGRNFEKAKLLQEQLLEQYPEAKIKILTFDVSKINDILQIAKPLILINIVGPFQGANYDIVRACINHKINYIDLADARDYVVSIEQFNDLAIKNNIFIISGASTVPALSSAVLEKYKNEFKEITNLKYGISPGYKAERGLATTEAIMSYVGKKIHHGKYGWQNIYLQKYPILGYRWMANCDIPDLEIFTSKYNIKNIQFSAGIELGFIHLGIWLLSWLIRIGMPINLKKHAGTLLKISNFFNFLGSKDGGMHMIMKGINRNHNAIEKKWFIIAKDNYGPYIPIIPVIIIVKKFINDNYKFQGAQPCVGVIKLEEYLDELKEFNVEVFEE